MMTKLQLRTLVIFLCLGCLSCNSQQPNQLLVTPTKTLSSSKLKDRILLPSGYLRVEVAPNSFAHYLRNLKLKPEGSKVKYFSGETKAAKDVYLAVLDQEIGNKNLHQCADAIIRLKADYHYHAGEYDKIKFNFTNGHRVAYSEWRKGKRIKIKGNKTWWDEGDSLSTSYEDYWKYLEQIFMYAGTHSLEKEMKSVSLKDMKIGDVLIQGGFPGHGVIVIDMAINPDTGQKLYMLAQSYMPAQQTQILLNNGDTEYSPWYKLDERKEIFTPEYSFYNTDLKRFPQ